MNSSLVLTVEVDRFWILNIDVETLSFVDISTEPNFKVLKYQHKLMLLIIIVFYLFEI